MLLLFLFIFFSLNFLRTKHCVRVSCLRIFSKKKKKIIRIILIKGRNIVRVEWIHILSYHTCIIRNRYLPQQVPLVSFSNLRLVHLCQAFHELTQILFSLSFGQLNPSPHHLHPYHHLQYYFFKYLSQASIYCPIICKLTHWHQSDALSRTKGGHG